MFRPDEQTSVTPKLRTKTFEPKQGCSLRKNERSFDNFSPSSLQNDSWSFNMLTELEVAKTMDVSKVNLLSSDESPNVFEVTENKEKINLILI